MLIGVDWGTTRLRAYLIGEDGWPVARTEADAGLLNVEDGDFEGVLAGAIGDWRLEAPDAPVLLSGMVGSRQGWVEAPYVPVPATAAALAANCARVATAWGEVRIVPGVVIGADGRGRADVMRGEETEIMGALAALDLREGTFVLPGTHSKWVTVEDGAITDFATFMTGEIFAAMRDHTILARMMTQAPHDTAAFAEGIHCGLDLSGPGALMTALFGVRVRGLLGRLGDDAAASYLSGLLIGAEVGSAAAGRDAVTIVAATHLASRYGEALKAAGIASRTAPADTAAQGLARIAARLP
ncbi:2-dehydro-3-deoxygalactonokinase [Acuticoccus sp. I52.16.1]|uniref:2-dehydro-3-deoxygalactonokinase n=1 Tax=Acuticoccus sp. I52.16.1 TaxID=2928472 RepID=UPI001FD2FADF|nr:2-dehydro-3-deoxygalactonokinase [Acuticoccus sp. I52.16.1]UOM34623.1 2-dehydro-3-deoxygalactonokinase [Acuticoccus sp. I52.16.1]